MYGTQPHDPDDDLITLADRVADHVAAGWDLPDDGTDPLEDDLVRRHHQRAPSDEDNG